MTRKAKIIRTRSDANGPLKYGIPVDAGGPGAAQPRTGTWLIFVVTMLGIVLTFAWIGNAIVK